MLHCAPSSATASATIRSACAHTSGPSSAALRPATCGMTGWPPNEKSPRRARCARRVSGPTPKPELAIELECPLWTHSDHGCSSRFLISTLRTARFTASARRREWAFSNLTHGPLTANLTTADTEPIGLSARKRTLVAFAVIVWDGTPENSALIYRHFQHRRQLRGALFASFRWRRSLSHLADASAF